jgi:membrane protease YdiL (CAAX protease family)
MSGVASYNLKKWLDLKVFAILTALGWLSFLVGIPYILALLKAPPPPMPMWIFLPIVGIQGLVQIALFVGVGLWLGNKVRLGAPVLQAGLAGDPGALPRFRALLPLSISGGVVVAAIILVLDKVVFAPWLPDALLPRSSPSPWLGFLGSFYGGIAEELLLRLGLMTLLVWVGTKITRSKHFSSAVIWIAIALTALLFGALHLPTTAQLVPLTAIVVTRALLLNGIPGLLFGWLYWRKGLEAAMVAHFSCDIVLHVIAVALSV